MRQHCSKTPKKSASTMDDLKYSLADETKEYKELCKEIDLTRQMGSTADITTNMQLESAETGNKNPFFDNTWGCSTIKNNLFKPQEQQRHYSSMATAFTDKNSLSIPSNSNYGYYPKQLSLANEPPIKKSEMNINIPSDSEDEMEAILNEGYEGDEKPLSPFNFSNRMRENFLNVCSSSSDSYLNNTNDNINNKTERNYQFRTPVNNMMNHSTPTFQFNQTIGKYPTNITPTTLSSSYMSSPAGYPRYDYPSAFSFNCNGMNQAKTPSSKQPKKDSQESKDFFINIEQIMCGNDHRTTLMIKNIPVKYSSQEIIAELQQNFNRKFDLFYLPMDYKNENNLGFAFINFIDPLHIIHFLHYYKGRKWLKYKSNKECDLFFAKFQGKDELIAHLKKNSKKTGEEKKAIIFPLKNPFPRITISTVYRELLLVYRPNLINLVDFI